MRADGPSDDADVGRRTALAGLLGLGGLGLAAGCGVELGAPALGAHDQLLSGAATLEYVDALASLPAAGVATTIYVVKGGITPGDGGGGLYRASVVTGGWERFTPDHLNVRWWGARGDGSVDDQPAIQAAIDASAGLTTPAIPSLVGLPVFIPPGTYALLNPVRVVRATGLPVPLVTRIYGAGPTSRLRGIASAFPSTRGIVELLGDSNSNAVSIQLSDLSIEFDAKSSGAYCLRLGNALIAMVERVVMLGGNCVGLLCGSAGGAGGYAHICTSFRSCELIAGAPTKFALKQDDDPTGGAFWDNVRFESCALTGIVNPKAVLAEFTSCTFTNPPGPDPAVLLYVYTAHFLRCRFTSFGTAIRISTATGAATRTVTVRECVFEGGAGSTSAIHVDTTTGTLPVERLSVIDSRFAVDSYSTATILNGTGTTPRPAGALLVDGATSSTATPAIRIKHRARYAQPNGRTQKLDGIARPEYLERVRWKGTMTAGLATIDGVISDLASQKVYLPHRACWVSKLTVYLSAAASSTLSVSALHGVTAIPTAIVVASVTPPTGAGFAYSFLEPWPAFRFNAIAADAVAIRMNNCTTMPAGTTFAVELELAS